MNGGEKVKKQLSALMIIFFVGVILCSSVSAADVTIDKTAEKTGTNTATITIVVNGSSSTTTSAADVVFAIDSSGSMSWNDPTNLRLTAANNFIDKMNPSTDQAGAVDWASSVMGTQALTDDFDQVKTFISGIPASGGTNLDAGLNGAIGLLDTDGRNGASHVIIFLTDGVGDYTPSGSAGSPADVAASNGYVIYSVGLGDDVDEINLQDMANATGGQYYFAADASALDPIFSAIFQQITTAATNVVVTDTLPNYLQLVGDPSVVPTTKVTNADGSTTMTWDVGTLSASESWTVNYNVLSTQFGANIPTNIGSDVSFTDPAGAQITSLLPVPLVSFENPNDDGNDDADTGKEVEAASTVGMQETGIPLVGMVLAILMVMGGFLVNKK